MQQNSEQVGKHSLLRIPFFRLFDEHLDSFGPPIYDFSFLKEPCSPTKHFLLESTEKPEGNLLRFATLPAWIDFIIQKKEPLDPLLMCYPKFLTATELVWMLNSYLQWKQLYTASDELNSIQEQIKIILSTWIESNYHKEWSSLDSDNLQPTNLRQAATRLASRCNFNVSFTSIEESEPKNMYNEDIQDITVPRTFLDIPFHEFVEQITYYDRLRYSAIKASEIVTQAFSNKDKETKAPNVSKISKTFNQRTQWFVGMILSAKSLEMRASIIERIIEIGNLALRGRTPNYDLAMIVFVALGTSAIDRLETTFLTINEKYKHQFEFLRKELSQESCFNRFRARMRDNTSFVPYLGIYLQDITFTCNGSLASDSKEMSSFGINIRKQRVLSEVIKPFLDNIRDLSHVDLDFRPEIHNWLNLQSGNENIPSEDDSYAISLELEPRGSNILGEVTKSQEMDLLWESVKVRTSKEFQDSLSCLFPNRCSFSDSISHFGVLSQTNKSELDEVLTYAMEILKEIWFQFSSSLPPCDSLSFRQKSILPVECRIIYISRSLATETLEHIEIPIPSKAKSARN